MSGRRLSIAMMLLAGGACQPAVVTRVQAPTDRFGDAAAVSQAPGGGWWNRANGPDELAANPD